MPTYEYICRSCGHLFEIVQSMKDDSLTECPQCGGELRKVFAPPAISFKGSGFYATDRREKATSSGSGADHGADGSTKKADAGTAAASKKAGSKAEGSGSTSKEGGSSGTKAAGSSTKED
jgi:putative FmdB family regulatory protein